MIRGDLVTDGWSSPEVHEALDLCLSCKGCARDCPTGVDMATYKSQVLDRTYRGRIRPRSHYTLGRLPGLVALGSRTPRVANAVLRLKPALTVGRWLAGVDQRRSLPRLARRTLRATMRGHDAGAGERVVLFADTFTDHFSPEAGTAAVRVLELAGASVEVPAQRLCCGLTQISTGQRDGARAQLRRTVSRLAGYARDGVPIVGLEPSCTAVLRDEAVELLRDDPLAADAALVAGAVRTLAEQLATMPGFDAPDLTGVEVVAQPPTAARRRCGAHRCGRLLRSGRQLRGREGPSRRLGGHRRARSVARGACGRAGGRGPRGRLLLPDAARRPRRRAEPAPRGAARQRLQHRRRARVKPF
jgi:Fe-S oxidoreductase